MIFRKRTLSVLLAVICLISALPAAALNGSGGISIREKSVDIGKETYLNTSTLYYSDALRAEEHYIKYTPSADLSPVVAYGTKLYGMSSANYVANYLSTEGRYVVAGINGDFFMTDTGIPIGIVVVDGILRSSDAGVNAIGFNPDGTAIIGKPALSIQAAVNGTTLKIDYVNKARKNYGVYLFTPDFSATTRTTTEGKNIILTGVSGPLTVGGTVTATVAEVTSGTAAANIKDGQLVISAEATNIPKLDGITAGMTVTISVSSGDTRWNGVKYAVGAGDMLVQNGSALSGLSDARAPRTAVGITAKGELIFYTVDGRQSGYSTGMSLVELADRLETLGAYTAVNLDGGGSTVTVAKYPGTGDLETINKPSDGKQRMCANYIFLVNNAARTDTVSRLHMYPYAPFLLANSPLNFTVKATDSNYYPVAAPANLSFSADGGLGYFEGSEFRAGSVAGNANLYVSGGGVSGSAKVRIIATPTAINITNEATGEAVTKLTLDPGAVVNLKAACTYEGAAVTSIDNAYTWEVAGQIGTIDRSGVFTADSSVGKSGTIRVTAGEKTVEIAVTVGKADVVIEGFEGQTATIEAGNDSIKGSIQSVMSYVKYGFASGKIAYSFTEPEQNTLALRTSWTVPSGAKYLRLWVYGDGSGNLLSAEAAVNSEKTALPVCTLDFTGYKNISVPLPGGTSQVSALVVTKGAAGQSSGTVYIDQVTCAYGETPDTTPPQINRFGIDLEAAPGSLTISAALYDNMGMIDPANVVLTMDGARTGYSYAAASGELLATVPAPEDKELHRFTVTVMDSAGNYARASLEYDLRDGGEESVFTDTTGHWSAPYIDYLYARGVVSGNVKDDGVFYYPDAAMKRIDFAVLMTKYLGLDTERYSQAAMPFADLDKIPEWARVYAAAMYSEGVITGKASNGALYFDPDATITRAEVMTIIGRTLPKGYAARALNYTDAGGIPAYSAEYISTLTGMGVLTGYSDNTIRPNAEVSRS
ncbi:MAG: phosphodiester glycosidase family protein, partial [Oscillospiraceae bacterium]|nr:phosphodiester glycosidase family protein [Oscillospiraceae bacterium]